MAPKHQRVIEPDSFDTIPEDVVLDNILPWLPIKSLCRFKSVCKKWRHTIRDHFCRISSATTASSSCMIFVSDLRVICIPTSENHRISANIPRSFLLDFLTMHEFHIVDEISASTNGLLCLVYLRPDLQKHICVCNPVTKEAWRIPDSMDKRSVGLAYNPSSSCNRYCYKLVHPIQAEVMETRSPPYPYKLIKFEFDVFSSDTGEWIKSDQAVRWIKLSKDGVIPLMHLSKSVFAKGVLYWNCDNSRLLWFDCNSDQGAAGYIWLPREYVGVYAEIGVCEDKVTCTGVTSNGVEVYRLAEIYHSNRDGKWEMIHQLSFEVMVSNNRDIFTSFLRYKNEQQMQNAVVCRWLKANRLLEWLVWPLAFEGGEKVVLWVKMKGVRCERFRLLSFDLKTGQGAVLLTNESPTYHDDPIYGFNNNVNKQS